MGDQRQSDNPQGGMVEQPQHGVGGATQTSGSKGQERQHGVKDMGSIGQDVPDQSKERNTEIAVEAGHKDGEHRETAMEGQPERDRIADEAVGQRHERAPPYAGHTAYMSEEEASRRFAASSGVEASIPEKTAEALGERVGDAYSDPESAPRHSTRKIGRQIAAQGESQKGVGTNRFLSASVKAANPNQERFLTVVASFALGYLAAVLFHHRINARFNATSGPLQITKPPVAKHPRDFVQATVLRTISEHPQGMTLAEITKALGREGIGQQSIANALSSLIQAKKISSEDRGGKYRSATDEVPTAPDQPSS
jgi:hypothetical protein